VILRLFTERVAERGYDAVTFREIAGELDISKGTIIHHFQNKEALLEELHHDYMRRRLDEAHELLATFSDPVEQLRAIIYQLMLIHREDHAATVAFGREIVRFAEDEVMAEVRTMRREYSRLVEGIIRRGVERRHFVEVDASVASLQVFGMCSWSWTWYEPGGDRSIEEIAADFCRTLLGGLQRTPHNGVDEETMAQRVKQVMDVHRPDVTPAG
jgi:AcrR family transcriptional regulator